MKEFDIEHIGVCVSDPLAMAAWYRETLGFKIKLSGGDGEKAVAFVTDSSGKVMLEFGKLPGIGPLSKKLDHHLQFHVALKSDDPEADGKAIVEKGGELIEKSPVTMPGDLLLTYRDPWGNCIQLAKRGKSGNG
jgi:catechol 2,3-dioxygenase-like lactoylglutathione lyase family enzyme